MDHRTCGNQSPSSIHSFFFDPLVAPMQVQRLPGTCTHMQSLDLETPSSKKVYYYCCKYPGCTYKVWPSEASRAYPHQGKALQMSVLFLHGCSLGPSPKTHENPYEGHSRDYLCPVFECGTFSQYFLYKFTYRESLSCYVRVFLSFASTD